MDPACDFSPIATLGSDTGLQDAHEALTRLIDRLWPNPIELIKHFIGIICLRLPGGDKDAEEIRRAQYYKKRRSMERAGSPAVPIEAFARKSHLGSATRLFGGALAMSGESSLRRAMNDPSSGSGAEAFVGNRNEATTSTSLYNVARWKRHLAGHDAFHKSMRRAQGRKGSTT